MISSTFPRSLILKHVINGILFLSSILFLFPFKITLKKMQVDIEFEKMNCNNQLKKLHFNEIKCECKTEIILNSNLITNF